MEIGRDVMEEKSGIDAEWIKWIDGDGVIHKQKRASQAQRDLIALLEDKLGYARANHWNMPSYKASAMITRFKDRLEKRNIK